MCYRASTPPKKELAKILDKEIKIGDYQAHYHTAGFAHEALPVMLSSDTSRVQPVIWGYVPEHAGAGFAEDFLKKPYSLNAKAETIFSVALYKHAAASQRCLIFVDGFFEWKHVQKAGKVDKVPHYIQMPDHKPFALGGLWSEYQGAKHCNILTTAANKLMTSIHNTKKRMPFILPENEWEQWLDVKAPEDAVKEMIQPFPEGFLEAHEISRMITARNVDADVPEVQEPLGKAS